MFDKDFTAAVHARNGAVEYEFQQGELLKVASKAHWGGKTPWFRKTKKRVRKMLPGKKTFKDKNKQEIWIGDPNTGGSCSILSAQWIYRKHNDKKVNIQDYLRAKKGILPSHLKKSVNKRDSLDLKNTSTFLDRVRQVVAAQEATKKDYLPPRAKQIMEHKPSAGSTSDPKGPALKIKAWMYSSKYINESLDFTGEPNFTVLETSRPKTKNHPQRRASHSNVIWTDLEKYLKQLDGQNNTRFYMYIIFGKMTDSMSENGHAIALGAGAGKQKWFFFDPNHGEASFSDIGSLMEFFTAFMKQSYPALLDYIYAYQLQA